MKKNYLVEVEVKQKVNLYINGEESPLIFVNITAIQTYELKANSVKKAMFKFLEKDHEIAIPEQYPDLEEETGIETDEIYVRDVLDESEPYSIRVFEMEENTYPVY